MHTITFLLLSLSVVFCLLAIFLPSLGNWSVVIIVNAVGAGLLAFAHERYVRHLAGNRHAIDIKPNQVIVNGEDRLLDFSSESALFASQDKLKAAVLAAEEMSLNPSNKLLYRAGSAHVRLWPASGSLSDFERNAIDSALGEAFYEPTIEIMGRQQNTDGELEIAHVT